MSDSPSTSMRTHVAVAIASATTTLALGLTVALFGGHVGSPPSSEPRPERAIESAPPPAGPVGDRAPDPIVLVPVERIEPDSTVAFAAADEPFVFDDDAREDELRRARKHHEHRHHEEHDDDD